MKKQLLSILLATAAAFGASAQVKVGDNPTTIHSGSMLEVEATDKALRITRVADTNAITSPAVGQFIFDISSDCFRGRLAGKWTPCFGGVDALPCTSPSALVCESDGTISAGGSITSTVTGGTPGDISWAITPTSGVSTASGTGASTGAITFSTAGTYTVTFTSTNSSNPSGCNPPASVTCTRTITVDNTPPATLAAFNCSAAVPNPSTYDISGTTYTGTVTLSYTGGDGLSYAGGSVASTVITGFTATWSAGTLATGDGSITISITGSSTTAGRAEFPITIAGKSCTIYLSTCGGLIAPGVFKAFLCHNLGANTSLDPHDMTQTDAWGLNGAYIQWGKRGPNTTGDSRVDWVTAPNNGPGGFAAAPTATNPNTAVTGWSSSYAPDYSWRTAGGAKTANDPCPAGWRVPTSDEWTALHNNNTVSRSGTTWTTSATNYNSALHYGPNASTKILTLPATGDFLHTLGTLDFRGTYGRYWSSTEDTTDSTIAYCTLFSSSDMYPVTQKWRRFGLPIRCIQE